MSKNGEPEIPIEDDVNMSPLDKYSIYGKYPYHMIIHILLLIFTTLQATVILTEFSDYLRAQEMSFFEFLIASDSKEGNFYARNVYLYNVTQLQNHLSSAVGSMLNANKTFLNTIIYLNEENEEINMTQFEMIVEYKNKISEINKNEYKMPIESKYQITADNLGPFNITYEDKEIKKYINIINNFQINYNFKINFAEYFREFQKCFIWTIKQIYDFSKRAHFEVGLNIDHEQCPVETTLSKYEVMMVSHLWIHLVVIILAIISVLFCFFQIYHINQLKKYRKALIRNQKNRKIKSIRVLKEIETIAKASNGWDIFIIISNFCQIVGSVIGLTNPKDMDYLFSLYLSMGVLLCYCTIGKYMSYYTNFSLFYRIMENSYSNFIAAIIAIMPLFLSFVFLGKCLFWNSEWYSDISNIITSFIAMINGDSISDILSDISDLNGLFGQIYGYAFIILFIVVIVNILIAILQSGFIKAKFDNKSNWIYNSLIKLNEEVPNENLKNLPIIDNMSPEEIKDDLEKRIISLNQGLNKCMNLIVDVENKNLDNENKVSFRKIIYRKVEEIDSKFQFIRDAWKKK